MGIWDDIFGAAIRGLTGEYAHMVNNPQYKKQDTDIIDAEFKVISETKLLEKK